MADDPAPLASVAAVDNGNLAASDEAARDLLGAPGTHIAVLYDAAAVASSSARSQLCLIRKCYPPTQDRVWSPAIWVSVGALLPADACISAMCWLHASSAHPVLAVGTSTGHLLFVSRDGVCLLQQLVHRSPVIGMRVSPAHETVLGTGFTFGNDLTVLLLPGVMVHFASEDILRLSQQSTQYGSTGESIAEISLPYRKWKLEGQHTITDAVCCGAAPRLLGEEPGPAST
jgi:hypothetical protein